MDESDPPDTPTMSGYLDYKNRAANGDYAVPNEATRAWMDNPEMPKPALMQYEDALVLEQLLKDKDAYNPVSRLRSLGF
jgi:hypothetical protein